ncbi:hypothetical protein NKH61_26880 [Mesorhizobium sp. M1005]|uniref:hypothetical protein n=1 Tax=unclassified Mesorhizobium TaxID=325217 RepID=UPI00333BBB73
MEVVDRDEGKAFSWVRIGFFFTAIYFGAVGWVILRSGPESLVQIKSGLQLNEFADAMAGMFAPLAFLWLFIATMVQSQELALQRRELKLTRREFELNRDVAKGQAEEAQKTAKFIGEQTKIMATGEYDKLIDAQIEGFERMYPAVGSRALIFRGKEADSSMFIKLSTNSYTFPAISERVWSASNEYRTAKQKFPDRKLYCQTPDGFKVLKQMLDRMSEAREGASPRHLEILRLAAFDVLVHSLDFIMSECERGE